MPTNITWCSVRRVVCWITAGLVLVLGGISTANALENSCDFGLPQTLRSIANSYNDELVLPTEFDSAYTRGKAVRVGVVLEANTPLVINRDDGEVEGIVADYLKIIGDSSRLSFKAIGYCDYAQVLAALEAGKIDLMAGTPILPQQGEIASHAFFTNRHVEVRPRSWEPNQRHHPEVVAIANNEPFSPEFLQNYHADTVAVYPNQLQGLLAVAYGNADLFVSNATAANYLIDQLQLQPLQIRNFASYHQPPYTFIANSNHAELINYINLILELLPSRATGDIQQRWFGGRSHYNIDDKLLLTEQELSWIHQHPVINYAAPADLAPLAFRERNSGQMNGLAIDVMNTITRRTGIKFNPIYVEDTGEGMRLFQLGKIDMLPGVGVNIQSNSTSLYTASFAKTLWGIMVRSDRTDINNSNDLAGKRVGVQSGTISQEIITNPQLTASIDYFYAPDNQTLMTWLGQGKVDAVLNNLLTANFLTSQPSLGQTKIVAVAGETPIQLAFAVNNSMPELKAIIDKVLESIPPEDLDKELSEWSSFKPKVVYVPHDNSYQNILILLKVSAVLLVLGALWFRFVVWSKRRQAARLHRHLLLQESLINGVPFALFIRTAAGELATFNPWFAEAREENLTPLLHSSDKTAPWPMNTELDRMLDQLCRDVQATNKPHLQDHSVEILGEQRDVFLWIIPLRNQEQSLLGGWEDISQRTTVQRQLESARVEAESANRTKSTFLATISHELRTPMNAILGLLELEIRGRGPVNRQTLGTVSASAHSLLRLLDDIIDSAKIEAGQLEVTPHPVALREELLRLFTLYQPIAQEKGLAFNGSVDEDMPAWLMADMLRVRQVVSNILGNALKFTRHGHVSVDVIWHPLGVENGELQIDITDTGIGISEQAQKALFQPFSQARDQHDPGFGGSGLGLWISSQLVKKMHGEIELESVIGSGTSLYITLPLNVAHQEHVDASAAKAMAEQTPATEDQFRHHALRVLVVDDLPANRHLLNQQLAYLGITRVSMAEEGREALDKLRNQTFDLLLTDCSMPVMDGYALAKAVRLNPDIAHIPIVGCTADARPEARIQCLEAGMDDCLTKPIGLDALQNCLCELGMFSTPEPIVIPYIASPVPSIRDAIHHFSGGDVQTQNTLLQSLYDSNRADGSELSDAMGKGNLHEAARLIHRIKSSAGMLGAQQLFAGCEQMERLIETEQTDELGIYWRQWQVRFTELNHQLAQHLNTPPF